MKVRFCLILFFVSILVSSCRKCFICTNECIECKNNSYKLCSTDYTSWASFGNARDFFNSVYSCNVIESSKSLEVCNDDVSVALLNNNAYKCLKK